jgi:tRNA U34 5-methylaminomethyl-2-thiouridine-forming methyltransferase MnmC
MKREIIITKDGSPTIYLPDLNEHYHSIHGAIQEAKHVFILNGLNEFIHKEKIAILEIGFGSGLNALLAAISCIEKEKGTIDYTGIEAFPLSDLEQSKMNYAKLLSFHSSIEIKKKINQSPWNENQVIHSKFHLTKINSKIEEFDLTSDYFDIVFYDAFGPRAQANMWTIKLFTKLFNALKENGLFVTYCAKGQVKRDLKAVGFSIESRPGPPGKREMTLAWKRF